jgi:cytochrome c-type biogenesis protein CcmH
MHGGRWAVMVVGFGIPVLAGSLYLGLGNPTTIGGVEIQAAGARVDDRHPESMEQMVANLAARLAANPNDPQGWSTLASSYMAMKRYSDAATALENLRTLVGDDPNVLVRYADALAMAGGGRLTGKPAQLIKQALTIDPNNSQGLWMAGMVARQNNDLHTALTHWRRLEPALANQPKMLAELQQQIASVVQRLGDESTPGSESTEPSVTASQPQPAVEQTPSTPAESPATVAGAASVSGTAPSITVRVSVSESLKQNVAPTDAVFIFARALKGPPMPLAVVTRQAADLPVTVTLDDNSAIMPAMTLSKFEEVMVGARISKSGTANPQSGDLQGEVAPVKTGDDEPVAVTISQIIP